ncbi:MAG: tetratricopeptide repeat protein, partial [Candidatus Hodarchaeales archaeon]
MLEKLKKIEGSIREGELNKAQSDLEKIKNADYNNLDPKEKVKVTLLLSKILERKGNYKLAIDNLKQFYSDSNYSFNNLDTSDVKLLKYFTKSKILLGRLLGFDGKINEAKEELSKTLKLSTDFNLLTSRLAATSEYGFVEFLSGNNTDAMNLTSQGFSLVKFLSNPLKERYWIYHFFNLRSIIDYYQGRYHEAIVNLIRVISTGKEFKNDYLLSVAHNMLSAAYRTVGEFELALEQSDYAINYANDVNDQFLKTKSISNKGLILINVGEFEQGVNLLNEALAIDQETNNLMNQPITLGNVSKALVAIGDRAKAEETFQETMKLYKQTSIEVEIVDKLCNYIDLLLEKGNVEEAEKLLDNCQDLVEKHNSNMDKIKFKLRKGMYFKVKGDLENARIFFTEARTLAETIDQYKDTIRASIFLAELNLEKTLTEGLDKELITEAFNNLDKAHFLSERTGLFPNIVKILLIRGTLYGAQLEFKKALETLDTALEISKERQFQSFHRQTKELYDRLKEREKFIRPSEEKDWQSIGMNEVLTYIR